MPLLCHFPEGFRAGHDKDGQGAEPSAQSRENSGVCGRLMCCLGYEHKLYVELLKGLPKEGEKVNLEGSSGKVVSVNALKRSITVDCGEGKFVELACKCPEGCQMH